MSEFIILEFNIDSWSFKKMWAVPLKAEWSGLAVIGGLLFEWMFWGSLLTTDFLSSKPVPRGFYCLLRFSFCTMFSSLTRYWSVTLESSLSWGFIFSYILSCATCSICSFRILKMGPMSVVLFISPLEFLELRVLISDRLAVSCCLSPSTSHLLCLSQEESFSFYDSTASSSLNFLKDVLTSP